MLIDAINLHTAPQLSRMKTAIGDGVNSYLCCCLISSSRPLIEALSAATAAMIVGRLWQETGTDRLLQCCRNCCLGELAAAGPALLLSRRAMPGDASCSDPEDLEGKSASQHEVASTAAIESLPVSQCTAQRLQLPSAQARMRLGQAPVIQIGYRAAFWKCLMQSMRACSIVM